MLQSKILLAAFTAGNVVVYRVGTGSGNLVNTGNAVFLDEFSPAGVLVQSIALPATDPDSSGPNRALVASGTASSEGGLTRSADGRYLIVPGYSSTHTSSLASSAPGTIHRVVGRVDVTGTIDTTTVFTDGGSNNIRGATSDDGTRFWVGTAAGGVRLVPQGNSSTSTQVVSSPANMRWVGISGGQLYGSSGSASSRLGTLGSGLPTSSASFSNLPGFPTDASSSPYAWFFADLSADVAGVDTVYVADDSAFALRKYSLVSGSWVLNGTIGVDADDYRGVTGVVSPTGTVTLFATRKGGSTASGGGELVRLDDATGYAGAFTGTPTLLASAGGNRAFRGVALAPQASVALPDLSVTLFGPASATVGVPFDYTLTLGNTGGANAPGVAATLTLPLGLDFQSVSTVGSFIAQYDTGTRTVTFAGGEVPAGASSTLGVRVQATAAATFTVPIGGAAVDPENVVIETNEGNNSSANAVTTVVTNATPNTPPGIVADLVATTAFLSVTSAGPTQVSGVIDDPTDPARSLGVVFQISDAETAASGLVVTATSGNPGVVPQTNLTILGTGATRTVRIHPTGVGHSEITVVVSDGQASSQYTLRYSASVAAATPSATVFPTGSSDASTAVAVDGQHVFVADDEDQVLRLYRRDHSGLPLARFDFTASLGLTDVSEGAPREVDLEASTRVGSTIYWLGSHSNSAGGANRPNRSRLFATEVSGSGAGTVLSYAGRYDHLKTDLLAWDSGNGHGLGANRYGLVASTETGVQPEGEAGFNLEGLTMAPDGTTAYLAFRAPLAIPTGRSRALIVPVINWASLPAASGGSSGTAQFGAPIELDLGGRGIREIQSNGTTYVLIAGPVGASGTFQLYTWNGQPDGIPVARSELSGLNPEGIVQIPAGSLSAGSTLQLVSDLGDTVLYGDGVLAKNLNPFLRKFRMDTVSLGAPTVKIGEIQGEGHTSPYVGQTVNNVAGVVTAVRGNGFYLQDPHPDANPNTSEAIFVFTSAAPTVVVGHSVRVSGIVSEFQPGGSSTGNLTTTQISSPTIMVVSAGNPLPAATIVGQGGRSAPTEVIDDDGLTSFQPVSDGIDFYESLEGMRLQVPQAVATGPTSSFGEIPILPDAGLNAGLRTSRGGIIVRPDDFNPERILLDDALVPLPLVDTGASLGTVQGVLDYSFGNFKLLCTVAPTATGGVTRETTLLQNAVDALTVAAFNCENLDPSDGAAKFAALAEAVVQRLQSPDILTIEEIQDNNGATNNSVVDAGTTLSLLTAAISAAGGPRYEARQINPVDDQDGGEPGGNIRVAFLFNPDRVSFIDRAGASATTAVSVINQGGQPRLSISPGRLDPTNPAFNNSRKPLAGEFTFQGETLFVVANHWNSKGGDRPLFGQIQPPTLGSEVQRNQQAQVVQDFVDSLLQIDPRARVIVAGDLNDFHFSSPLKIVTGQSDLVGGTVVASGRTPVLQSLVTMLPPSERYTYVFDGNSQDLDHILASSRLVSEGAAFDVVHINSEFSDQVSDHDPLVSRFVLQFPPRDLSVSSLSVPENSPVGTVVGVVSATDLNVGDTLTYSLVDSAGNRFSLDTRGGVTRLLVNGSLDLEQAATHSVTLRATDAFGLSTDAPFTVNLTNVVHEVVGFDVQRGQVQRSFVRLVEYHFQDTSLPSLQSLLQPGRVQLLFLGVTGSGATPVGLSGRLSVALDTPTTGRLTFNAGLQGIGGNRAAATGNGYYRLSLDLDSNGSFETQRTFHRLLGDLTGDRAVTSSDRDLLNTLGGLYDPNRDVNGDGVVDARDRVLIKPGLSLPLLATDD